MQSAQEQQLLKLLGDLLQPHADKLPGNVTNSEDISSMLSRVLRTLDKPEGKTEEKEEKEASGLLDSLLSMVNKGLPIVEELAPMLLALL